MTSVAMGRVTVERVEGRSSLRRFIEFPYQLYRGDPNWVPPLLIGEWEKFNPRKNPFFEHARMDLYLAWRENRVVGRIAAIDDDNHNATHGDNLLFFGFFEACDEEVAGILLRTVEDRARQLGRTLVRGPANPSMNDGSGFQLEAFDTRPYVMMPQNPPEYPRYVEAAGYGKAMDLYAWEFDVGEGTSERLARLAQRVKRRHPDVTIRGADMKNLERDAAILKRIYNEAWEKNWGFVKYTEAEFDALISELKLILEPDLVLFVEVDGEVAGLSVTIPDINQVFSRIGGRLLPFGILCLLQRRRYVNRGRMPILGVLPEFRGRGFELLLIDETARRARELGWVEGECSWVLETNTAMNRGIEVSGATLYKRYRLYQKAV